MTNEITTEKVQEALRTIMSPGDSGGNIIDNGAVSGIVLKDGHVGFSIDIDPSIAESAQDMRRAAEQAVLNINGVLSATAMLTAHNAKPNTAPQQQQQTSTSATSIPHPKDVRPTSRQHMETRTRPTTKRLVHATISR